MIRIVSSKVEFAIRSKSSSSSIATTASMVILAATLVCSCAYQLQTRALLHGVTKTEITGKVSPIFKQVLRRTIHENSVLERDEPDNMGEIQFKIDFISTNETITHLRFDEFREPLQSEVRFECAIAIGTDGEKSSTYSFVDVRRFNHDRQNLLAVTAEQQDAREDLYHDLAFRIVLLLAELREESSKPDLPESVED